MRYRDMERIDLGTAREAVRAWLDEHQGSGGTLTQMTDELRRSHLDYPEEMAIVLRGMMAAELRRRTQSGGASPVAGVLR
jgi:hypothetical protein